MWRKLYECKTDYENDCIHRLYHNIQSYLFMKGGMDSSAAGWIAYGFVWLAILVSYIAPLYCKNYKRIPENLITNYTFSWIYSGIAILFNAVVLLAKVQSVSVVLILNVIFCIMYLQQLFISLRVNYEVETNLEQIDAERQFVQEVSKTSDVQTADK